MAARDDEPGPGAGEGTDGEGTESAESGKAKRSGALLVPDALVRISIGIIILEFGTCGVYTYIECKSATHPEAGSTFLLRCGLDSAGCLIDRIKIQIGTITTIKCAIPAQIGLGITDSYTNSECTTDTNGSWTAGTGSRDSRSSEGVGRAIRHTCGDI